MIKRTLFFSKPASLRKRNSQLYIKFLEGDIGDKTVPIEDIGVVVLENPRITISQGLLAALSENNSVVINCDKQHMPFSMLLPTAMHHAYTEKVRYQMEASLPLKKNMWQQTVVAKIQNQSDLIRKLGKNNKRLDYLAGIVKSDDAGNCEGRAASYYWKILFSEFDKFSRHRFGEPPNNLLNYGYAILRGVVARSLVASGLLTVLGIHHRNKYNPYCLADDVMEPYRPFVDMLVITLVRNHADVEELTTELKGDLLGIPAIDVRIEKQCSPLMVGMQRTTASIMKCYEGSSRKIIYPEFL